MRRVLPILGLGAFVLGCSDGAPGDLDRVPPRQGSSILGDGSRIRDLNDPATNPPDGTLVSVTAASIGAVDGFDETGDGSSAGNIFVQDLPVDGQTPAYGGVTLYNSSFNPPTLRVGPGDVVDLRGTYDEFEGPPSATFAAKSLVPGDLPEIVGATITLRFESKVPEPITIPISDLATYDTGRKWIGVLARVENVKCFAEQQTGTCGYLKSGRFDVKLAVTGTNDARALPTIGNDLFDLCGALGQLYPADAATYQTACQSGENFPLADGSTFKSVTGIVQYFYTFTITPRSIEDIEL